MRKIDTKTIAYLSVLTAMEIVLSRFLSISAWNIKIGFSFVPIAVAAILFGPLQAGIVGALGDFLGAILFPIGPYFPGFTLTAFLVGVVLGLLLREKQTPIRIITAVGINQLILGLLLNSCWISILYKSPFVPLLGTRIIQSAILLPVQFAVILFLSRTLIVYRKRLPA